MRFLRGEESDPGAASGHAGRCGSCKALLGPWGEPLDVDESAFTEIVQAVTVPVLTDFWAAWCGPCLAAAPEVKELARELAGKALVLKVNTEEIPDWRGALGCSRFPILWCCAKARSLNSRWDSGAGLDAALGRRSLAGQDRILRPIGIGLSGSGERHLKRNAAVSGAIPIGGARTERLCIAHAPRSQRGARHSHGGQSVGDLTGAGQRQLHVVFGHPHFVGVPDQGNASAGAQAEQSADFQFQVVNAVRFRDDEFGTVVIEADHLLAYAVHGGVKVALTSERSIEREIRLP